ncbi:hypothetical protein D9619_005328 [Psilocybe cf. subviscida]|uniref:C2H2-type domain-containing protein n=1 Tax=Psilocybe cf. subviscida TaxID=2480587 RepID=A0A8H5BWY3_9AGAR|nr:hypothetical protein D9619_005328 [Psilocybe cf. subviscida]
MPRGSRRRIGLEGLKCPLYPRCNRTFRSEAGRTNHVRSLHPQSNRYQVPAQPSFPDVPGSFPASPPWSHMGSPANSTGRRSSSPKHQPDPTDETAPCKTYHPFLNGRPCDTNGVYLPTGTPPPPRVAQTTDDWSPFVDGIQYRVAEFLFRQDEMSKMKIDTLLELWSESLQQYNASAPYERHSDMYATIDTVTLGDAPWKCFKTTFDEVFDENTPRWKRQEYDVWFRDPLTVLRNMLENPDFDHEWDSAPYVELDSEGNRRRSDFMSADFAWRQCDKIYAENPENNDGSMFVPIVLGADKTTVTVGTGNVEYHPLYLTTGNVHNRLRRAHRNAVIPIGFLAIPKADRKYDNDPAFRKFKKQLYHSSIACILQSLRPAMTTPVVLRCPDGHFRRVIFGLGPFIADYPEQVFLTGIKQGWCPRCTALPADIDAPSTARRHILTDALIDEFEHDHDGDTILWDEYGIDVDIVPFTRDFPRADIHELISSDLLHQAIKGTFKDHLVDWVDKYLEMNYDKAEADRRKDEIDKRLAATPAFPELRRFKDGIRFKQWTGDDSKALMKVYIPAIYDLVEPDVVKCIGAFLDFCFIARRSDFDTATLNALDEALSRFHTYREVFRETGVRDTFSLPRQHSLVHYRTTIRDFGAPNGLCSSITESRHITAVKKPWRRSNKFDALSQMLLTNQRLDKIAAAQADFIARGMLPPDHEPIPGAEHLRNTIVEGNDDDDGGPVERVLADVQLARTPESIYPSDPYDLAAYIDYPDFPRLLRAFLDDQLGSTSGSQSDSQASDTDDPLDIISPISVYHSATATFFAPSDPSGQRGMRRERIRCTPSWRKTGPRRDCAFVVEDQNKRGFRGMSVVRTQLLFSFSHEGEDYPCALVEWYKKIGRGPEASSGMWQVTEELLPGRNGGRLTTVVHLDSILRGAHLIPVYGDHSLPDKFKPEWTLDSFTTFFVNKYADHHSNEIAF